MTRPIHLQVLGSRDLRDAHGVPVASVLAQPKRFALLVYLVLNSRAGTISRDEILGMFWPEQPDGSARNSLAQALSFLRRALGRDVVVNVGAQGLRVDPKVVTCDAVNVLDAAERGEHAVAVQRYVGVLLQGFFIPGADPFERWLDSTRRRLHTSTVASGERLRERHRAAGDFPLALEWAESVARLEPLSERATRAVMELCITCHEGPRALRAFQEHAHALRTFLEVLPSSALISLRDSIRVDRVAIGAPVECTEQTVDSDVSRPVQVRALPPDPQREHGRAIAGWWPAVGVVATALLITASVWRRNEQGGYPVAGTHARIVLDDSVRLRSDLTLTLLALDPDGSRLLYVGGAKTERLYVQSLNEPAPHTIQGTERARLPQFTADGQSVAFRRDGGVQIVRMNGGAPRTLIPKANRYSLGSDGSLVYEAAYEPGRHLGLLRISELGAPPSRLTTPDKARGERMHVWPHLLPGAQVALFAIGFGDPDSLELAAVRISDGSIVHLGVRGLNPRFVSPGYVVFGHRTGVLMGVRFDPVALRVTSQPVTLLTDINVLQGGGETQIAFAANGTMAYLRSDRTSQLTLIDPVARRSQVIAGPGAFSAPRLSPDEKRVAVVVGTVETRDVWLVNIASRELTQFTHDGRSDAPEWSADGSRLLWRTQRASQSVIHSQPLDRSESPHSLVVGASSVTMSPSGDRLAVAFPSGNRRDVANRAQIEIMVKDPRGLWATTSVIRGQSPAFSADGRLIAYSSVDPDSAGIFVRGLAPPFHSSRVSSASGRDPVWGEANRLFYREGNRMVAVGLDLTSANAVGDRRLLDVGSIAGYANGSPHYDVTRDGRHLLVVEPLGNPDQPVVVFRWAQSLRARLARVASK